MTESHTCIEKYNRRITPTKGQSLLLVLELATMEQQAYRMIRSLDWSEKMSDFWIFSVIIPQTQIRNCNDLPPSMQVMKEADVLPKKRCSHYKMGFILPFHNIQQIQIHSNVFHLDFHAGGGQGSTAPPSHDCPEYPGKC